MSITAACTCTPCFGISAALPELGAIEIEGHRMVEIPGGYTVIGSHEFSDPGEWGTSDSNPPRWIRLSSYLMKDTVFSNADVSDPDFQNASSLWRYRGMERKDAPADHPFTQFTHCDTWPYLREAYERRGIHFTRISDARWENAFRGPAVDVRETIGPEIDGMSEERFLELVEGRYENFVSAVFEEPLTARGAYHRLLMRGLPIFAWRVHNRPEGQDGDAWEPVEGGVPVDHGARNEYGIYVMAGGVQEWMCDHHWNSYSQIFPMSRPLLEDPLYLRSSLGAMERSVRRFDWISHRIGYISDIPYSGIGFRAIIERRHWSGVGFRSPSGR
jgi:formylglycine-generating enzyme required for sulfatase activity